MFFKRSLDLKKPFVFISYARENQATAEALRKALGENGIQTFMDLDMFNGTRWRSRLKKRLEQASVVLVIWSHHAVKSDHVIWEANFAWNEDEAREADDEEALSKYMAITINGFDLLKDGVQPFSERNYTDFSRWNLSPDHELLRELARETYERCHPAQITNAAKDDDSLSSQRERSFARLVDREPLVKEADRILKQSLADVAPILLVDAISSDWLEAFSDHLMVRQNNHNYAALESGNLRELCAIGVSADVDAENYHSSFLACIGKNNKQRDGFAEWFDSGPELKVVYTAFIMPDAKEEIRRYIAQVRTLVKTIPDQSHPRRRLLVVFGCLRTTEEKYEHSDYGPDVHWLEQPGEITRPHIDIWYQRLPGKFEAYYDKTHIDRGLELHLPEGKALRYKRLEAPLLEILKNARISSKGEIK